MDKITKPRIVLKIGTSTLTAGTQNISRGKIEDIARQILELKVKYDVLIVSSGAVAAARQFDKLNDPSKLVENKPSLSAIGQPKLMQLFIEVFSDYGLQACQCLLTHFDFEGEDSRHNTKTTITDLLYHDYIPIINENDTVAVEEIILGDNDKLSAYVSVLMEAEKLFIASDIDGIFDANPKLNPDAKLVKEVKSPQEVRKYVEDVENGLGTGGMESKINALEICAGNGIEVYILNGGIEYFLLKAFNDEIPYTVFKG